jgi:hypothetical protein
LLTWLSALSVVYLTKNNCPFSDYSLQYLCLWGCPYAAVVSGILILENDLSQIQGFQRGLPGITLRVVSCTQEAAQAITNGCWDFIFLNGCPTDTVIISAWIAEHSEKFKNTYFYVGVQSAKKAKTAYGILYRARLPVYYKYVPWQDSSLMRSVMEHLKKTAPGSI